MIALAGGCSPQRSSIRRSEETGAPRGSSSTASAPAARAPEGQRAVFFDHLNRPQDSELDHRPLGPSANRTTPPCGQAPRDPAPTDLPPPPTGSSTGRSDGFARPDRDSVIGNPGGPGWALGHHKTKTTLALAVGARRDRPSRGLGPARAQPPAGKNAHHPSPRCRSSAVSAPGGFDWSDAGIGAAGALGLSTLAIGTRPRDRRQTKPNARRAGPPAPRHATSTSCRRCQPRLAPETKIGFRPTGGSQMTHARTNQMAAPIVALALTIAVALSTTTRPGDSQDV